MNITRMYFRLRGVDCFGTPYLCRTSNKRRLVNKYRRYSGAEANLPATLEVIYLDGDEEIGTNGGTYCSEADFLQALAAFTEPALVGSAA